MIQNRAANQVHYHKRRCYFSLNDSFKIMIDWIVQSDGYDNVIVTVIPITIIIVNSIISVFRFGLFLNYILLGTYKSTQF